MYATRLIRAARKKCSGKQQRFERSCNENSEAHFRQYIDSRGYARRCSFLECVRSRFLDSDIKCCAAPGGKYATATEVETVVQEYERNQTRKNPRPSSVAYFNNLLAARLSLKRFKSRGRRFPLTGIPSIHMSRSSPAMWSFS